MSCTQLSTRTLPQEACPERSRRRTEAGLAGERDIALALATGADIAGITGIGIAAGYETLDDLSDERIPLRVGLRVWGDFVFQALVAPAVPVVAEYLSKMVVGSGMARLLPRR